MVVQFPSRSCSIQGHAVQTSSCNTTKVMHYTTGHVLFCFFPSRGQGHVGVRTHDGKRVRMGVMWRCIVYYHFDGGDSQSCHTFHKIVYATFQRDRYLSFFENAIQQTILIFEMLTHVQGCDTSLKKKKDSLSQTKKCCNFNTAQRQYCISLHTQTRHGGGEHR